MLKGSGNRHKTPWDPQGPQVLPHEQLTSLGSLLGAFLNHGGKDKQTNWSKIVFTLLVLGRELAGFLFFDLWLLYLISLDCDLYLPKAFGGETQCSLFLNSHQNMQRMASNIQEEACCLNHHLGATWVLRSSSTYFLLGNALHCLGVLLQDKLCIKKCAPLNTTLIFKLNITHLFWFTSK